MYITVIMLIEINTNVSVFSHNFAFLEPLSVILNIYGVRINHKCEMFLSSSLVDGNKHPYILQSLSCAGVMRLTVISVVHFKERRPLHFSTLQYSILITSDIDNDNHTE